MSIIYKRLQIVDLRKSGMLYRKVIENLPQRISVKDASLAYVFCNEAFAQDLNIKPAEISGKSDYDFFPRELAAKMIAEENEILHSGVKRQVKEKYVFSGKEVTVLATKSPVRSDNGDIIGLQVVWQDITKDKRRAESLVYLIKNLEDQVIQGEERIEAVKNAFERMAAERCQLEAAIKDLREGKEKHIAASDAKIEKLKNDLQRGTTERKEVFELLQKSFTQIRDLMNSAQDLTLRSKARDVYNSKKHGLKKDVETLQQSSQVIIDAQNVVMSRYRVVFEKLPYGIYMKNADMKYLYCNEAYAQMISMRAIDIQGRTDRGILSQESADQFAAYEQRVWYLGQVMEGEENHLVNGEERTFLASRRLIEGDDDIASLLGVLIDITERKRQEGQWKQLFLEHSRQIESLMSDVVRSHKFAKQQEEEFKTLRASLEMQISLRDVKLEKLQSELQQQSENRKEVAQILMTKVSDLQNFVSSAHKYLDS
jgi:PAS domain S-box-containing protein